MMTEPAATRAALLASLTHLMASWSSTSTQAAIAADAEVSIDPLDIPPLYMLGLRGRSRASELAAALHVTRPTMSKQLARLERAELIERTSEPDDRRTTVINLSASGAAAYERLVAQGVRMLHLATADWCSDEVDLFADQFSRFVEALRTQTDQTGSEPATGPVRSRSRSQNGGKP